MGAEILSRCRLPEACFDRIDRKGINRRGSVGTPRCGVRSAQRGGATSGFPGRSRGFLLAERYCFNRKNKFPGAGVMVALWFVPLVVVIV